MSSNFNLKDEFWPKLGVSSTSKSIVRTPAQDRLSRLRKVLADNQKQTQVLSKEIIQSAQSSGLASASLGSSLPIRPRKSVQDRLIKARNATSAVKVTQTNEPSTLKAPFLHNLESAAGPSKPVTPFAERCRTTCSKGPSDSLFCPAVLCDLLSTPEKVLKSPNPDKSLHTSKNITEPINTKIKARKRKPNSEDNDAFGKINKTSPKSELSSIMDEFLNKSPKSEQSVINKKTPRKTGKSDQLHRIRKSLQKRVESLPPVEKMDVEEDEFSTIRPPATVDTEAPSFTSNIMALFQKIKDNVAGAFSNDINIKSTYHRVTKETQSDIGALHSRCIYVVADTNIFLHHLTFIKDLLERPIQKNTAIILYVPYVVIEELDRLKGQNDRSISTLAMRAVKYLNEKLENRDKSIRGQTIVESLREIIPVKLADDAILNCCLQLKEKKLRFLLLSNDINLRNKALINDVRALSSADVEVDNIQKFL